MIKENYGRAISKLSDDIDRWIRLPLSLVGRVSLMKMIVLPRFLFLFTHIPIVVPQNMFRELRTLLCRLAWAGKSPRVSFTTLTKPYSSAGLGAPDLELYYRVAQASHGYAWIHGPANLPHLQIEKVTALPDPFAPVINATPSEALQCPRLGELSHPCLAFAVRMPRGLISLLTIITSGGVQLAPT